MIMFESTTIVHTMKQKHGFIWLKMKNKGVLFGLPHLGLKTFLKGFYIALIWLTLLDKNNHANTDVCFSTKQIVQVNGSFRS